jgi:electron transfer flavoprotein alpha subunit
VNILVIAESSQGRLKESTYSSIGAATMFQGNIDVLVFGQNTTVNSKLISGVAAVNRVIECADKITEHNLPESVAQIILEVVRTTEYTHIIMGSTTTGKNILPRVAALLDVEMVSDIIEVIDSNTYKRPIYAGNAIATIKNNSKLQIISIRPTAFEQVPIDQSMPEKVEVQSFELENNLSSFISMSDTEKERPDLSSAKIVVSGGRGLQSKENFKIVEQLADKLNAAIGASRAAVDAGFVANDLQVGQTGKVVAPDLYIAIGISGAIQHIAGMKDSKVIVVINKDADAPIFQIADYGLVGDLFDLVPKLCDAL